MSFILLGILNSAAGGIAQVYFLNVLKNSGLELFSGVAINSSDEIYTTGLTASAGAGGQDLLVSKYDAAGTILSQRVLGGAANDLGISAAIDATGNIYVAGNTTSQGEGDQDYLLVKYDSALALQFQRILGGSNGDRGEGVALDSSGNAYIVGLSIQGSPLTAGGVIAKYNTSGTLQFQARLSGAGSDRFQKVAIDASDNVYAAGFTASSGGGGIDLLLAKYNTSGTLQLQRTLGSAADDRGNAIAVDSDGNVYVVGQTADALAGNDDFLIVKYNSSGTVQWQRALGGTGSQLGNAIAVDSDGNVYVAGETSDFILGFIELQLAKYDSSGTIQWQRAITSTATMRANSISIDGFGNIIVAGSESSTGGGTNCFLAKLPNDGSLTGTYTLDGASFTYAASTLTASTSTLSAGTPTLTASTPTLVAATSTLTDAASSLTSVTLDITP